MARRRPQPSPPPRGLLSGVLSFVSREFESFVANATGVPPAADDSQKTLVEDDEEYSDDDEDADDEDRRRRRRDRSPPRKRSRHGARSHSRKRSPSPDTPPRKRRSVSHVNKRRRRDSPDSECDSDKESQTSSSSETAPVPLLRVLKRRPSITMPGSLFPRSPSMEPDSNSRPPRGQHVRFTSSTLRPSSSPAPPPPDSYQGSDVPPDPATEQGHQHASSSSSSPSTPRRNRTNVLSAAEKFHVGAEDAGPSILFPSPHTSPSARGNVTYSAADKGKGRAMDDHGDTSGVLRVRGKEQELVAAQEELDRHQRLLTEDYEDEDGETSFLQQVEKDRDRDKARIRMLEEEIARLKQELSKRLADRSFPPPPPPPPPPPGALPRKTLINLSSASDDPYLFASARASLKQAPPPIEKPIVPARRTGIATVGIAPDKMAAFLNEMKTVRLRKTHSAASMRDRDVHANGNATFVAPTPPSRVAQLAPRRSLEGLHHRRPLLDEDAPMAPEEWEALRARVRAEIADDGRRAGEKRKRGDANVHAEDAPAKRVSSLRIGTTGVGSATNSSFGNTSTSTSGSGSSTQRRGLPRRISTPQTQPTQSQSQLQQASPPQPPDPVPTPTWQTSSVTSAPTPSLCSDNDNEPEPHGIPARDEDEDEDDQAPVTPPVGVSVSGGSGPSRSFFRFKGNGVPVEGEEERSMRIMGRSLERSFVGDRSESEGMGESMRAPSEDNSRRTPMVAEPKAKARARPLTSGIPRPKTQRPQAQPPAVPARTKTPPQQIAAIEQTRDKEDRIAHGPEENADAEESTLFICARRTGPRANISFLASRVPTSPMPAKSPRRPRAPGRVVSRGSTASGGNVVGRSLNLDGERYTGPGHTPGTGIRRVATDRYDREHENEGAGEDEGGDEAEQAAPPLLPSALSVCTPSPPSRASARGKRQSQNASQARDRNQSQSQSKPPQPRKSNLKPQANSRPKTTLKRRLTLDDELRNAVPFLHDPEVEGAESDDGIEEGGEDDHVDPSDAYMAEVAQQDADEVPHEDHNDVEDLDSGVLVGLGTRSKRRGFLAHGGAGGPPVFMGVGYVECAEDEPEEQEHEQDGEGKGGAYDEEEYDDAGQKDDDDDEYLPSPEPRRARQGSSQRRS